MIKKLGKTEILFIRNLLLTTVLGGVIGFLNYLFNIGVARFTSDSIFSVYGALLAIITLAQIPATAIQSTLTKTVGENKDGNLNVLRVKSFVVFTILGIFIGIIFLISTPVVVNFADIPTSTMLPLALTLTLALISPIAKGFLLGEERIVTVNLIMLVETILRFAIGILAIYLGGNLTLLILASGVPAFIGCILVLPFIKFKQQGSKRIDINYKDLLLMTVCFLLLSIPYTVDVILTPVALRAEYFALALIGKIVYFSAITIAFVMFARLSNQKDDRKEFKTLGITIVITLLIGFAATIFITIFKQPIIEFAFGGNYQSVGSYFLVYGILMSVYAAIFMVANFFITRNSYWYILILSVISLFQVFLFLNFNDSIVQIVKNQVFVYASLTIFTGIYFILNFLIKPNEKERIKKIS